ncbi:MAG: penicillin-binding protein 1B [Deltaproteobacteria bacterium]|nr:penicillin-binding protein 1B [Deltaproteobacteria bacterium]
MATKRKTGPKKAPRKKYRPLRAAFLKLTLLALLIGTVGFIVYGSYLDKTIRRKFDGKRWSIPAVVYARPLELYVDLALTPETLEEELQLGGYRREQAAKDPGGYERGGNVIRLVTRDFAFADGLEKSAAVTVSFSGQRIASIKRTDSGETLPLVRLDPARIGSFHPREHEDRILLARKDLPNLLVKTLIAVEDRHFYRHFGVDPLAVIRAMFANIRAGETVQGGSTLTQQLVKNFFLDNRRTLWRKINEAVMAVLLEMHYSKDEILTAYANEIFLGQDGGRAVHGFGLASQFYFRRDLADISPAQIALLVGLIKGPSYYDPRRHVDRCLQRRQAVLDMMLAEGVIDREAHKTALAVKIEEGDTFQSGFNRYPAFLALVRRHLDRDYHEEDLTTDGLKILTTLDPQVQMQVERELSKTLAALEKQGKRQDLEGAVVVSSREGGEILAVAGGRKPRDSGFNRALDAMRPIGSLIKPAVYLTALQNGYTLASPVQDVALTLDNEGGKKWRPANFDKKEHGRVPLYEALAHSYNLATVRTGMDIGVEKVAANVRLLGVDRDFPPLPSFLLGAAPMTPLEVSQMYQTLASGGFYLPQRVIGEVLTADNKLVKRYGLSVEQRFGPELVFLLNTALKKVVSEGTGRGLGAYLPDSLQAAGKTGTSDDLRDSWFVGFTGDRLGVVWIGCDDNKPTGLTGATGALVAWGNIMRSLHPQVLELAEPPGIEWGKADLRGFAQSGSEGRAELLLPFIAGSMPQGAERPSASPLVEKIEDAGASIFNTIRGWFR